MIASAAVYALRHQESVTAISTPAPLTTPSRGIPSPAATAAASATPAPVALGSPGRPATAAELAAMVAAGKAPAERDLHLGDWSTCAPSQSCFRVRDGSGVIGVGAGTFGADQGCPAGCGSAGCTVFLYEDQLGWHYVNAHCAQGPGSLPGPRDLVYVSGCANVRNRPGFQSVVVDCLPNGTTVNVDSAPAYVDGRLWWHLENLGWMAHDFLVGPPA